MIRHLVMWRFQDTLSAAEKQAAASKMKHDIEALQGKIDGVLSLQVHITDQASSSRDILLDSTFTTAQALAAYQTNPLHVAVSQYVATIAGDRACIDYSIN